MRPPPPPLLLPDWTCSTCSRPYSVTVARQSPIAARWVPISRKDLRP